MFKKIILALTAFAIVCIAYTIYQWQDDTPLRARQYRSEMTPRVVQNRPRTTQPTSMPSAADKMFTIRDFQVPPGEAPFVQVYDRRGNATIVFQSISWHAVSDNAFHMTEPTARLLLPDGQLAYVRADQGEVEVQRGEDNNLNPKTGWFRGHVRIFIDLTKPKWRKDNPDQTDPEQHPDRVVKIWLDDVRFDLDLAMLESEGPIVLQSPKGTVEGRGLKLVWDEVSRRIKELTIFEGKRATLRTASLTGFGLPGSVQLIEEPKQGAASITDLLATSPPATTVEKATKPKALEVDRHDQQLAFLEPDEHANKPKEDRIDTFRVEFNGNVSAESREGIKVAGWLKADVLELMMDFGLKERSLMEEEPKTQPAGDGQDQVTGTADTATASLDQRSTIELHWTGELKVISVAQTEGAEQSKGGRFHVVAKGNPVEVYDRKEGKATCLELKYQDETKQVWLIGSAEVPVVMETGQDRRLTGERIFFDRQTGRGRAEGAGRMMVSRKGRDQAKSPPAMIKERETTGQDEESENIEIAWNQSVQIEFGLLTTESPDPDGGPPIVKKLSYLKHAVFDGQVTFKQEDQWITADHAEVPFMKPRLGLGDSSGNEVIPERIHALGNVHMSSGQEEVHCNRLEVEMTLDDTGRPVPKIGRAIGNVTAKNVDRRTGKLRRIEATDEVVISLASIPKRYTPTDRARFEAKAKGLGYKPDSPEWLEAEARLRKRRELITTALTAMGDVKVKLRDPQDTDKNLDVISDSLDCALNEEEEITRALIIGNEGQPAQLTRGDFHIRGAQISLDRIAELVEVPGAGMLRFYTRKDLDGRPVDEPIPVVVTWENQMLFRGKANTGTFTGQVRAVSANNTLACDQELRLQFENLPKPPVASPNESRPADSRWIAGPILDRMFKDQEPSEMTKLGKQMRKRLASLRAVGKAVILSTDYPEPEPIGGPVTGLLRHVLPDAWQPSAGQPAVDDNRLFASRVRVAGPQITIDLDNEYFSVDGAGNLLIEDYRISDETREKSSKQRATLLGRSSVGTFGSSGPSQTLFTWENSMTFLNNRNVAVLDHTVVMRHRTGTEMVLSKGLEAAMHADLKKLSERKGRHADMTCDNLLVEFSRDKTKAEPDSLPLSRARSLKVFRARGAVRLQESEWFVEGTLVTYNNDTGIAEVNGSPQLPAQVSRQDERTGSLTRVRSRPGEAIIWDHKNGVVKIKGSSILATGE